MGVTKRNEMKMRKERKEKKARKVSQKPSPMQTVKAKFEKKLVLAEKIIPFLERKVNETDEEFKKRMSTLSNTKLLKLNVMVEEFTKEFQSKDQLAEAVYKKVRGTTGKVDNDYLNKLKTLSIGRLMDMHKFYKRSETTVAPKLTETKQAE